MINIKRLALACSALGVLAYGAFAADAAAGKTTYLAKCKTCHGPEGQGNPGMAKALKVEIRPLGDAEVQKKSDAELKKNVVDGIGKMKATSGLAAGDADNIVAFMRTLKK